MECTFILIYKKVNMNTSQQFWSEEEARDKQIPQNYLGESSCGVASILSAFRVMNIEFSKDEVKNLFKFNKRSCSCKWYNLEESCNVDIKKHLIGRSKAGISSKEIDENGNFVLTQEYKDIIRTASKNKADCVFYPWDKIARVGFHKFVIPKMANQMIPIVTLNLQKKKLESHHDFMDVPDYWHSQMIFKIEDNNVFLTNPIKSLPINTLMSLLCSESVLLVQKQEVVHHCRNMTKEEICNIKWPDKVWEEMKVTEQILETIEEFNGTNEYPHGHVKIPTYGKGGITFIYKTNF